MSKRKDDNAPRLTNNIRTLRFFADEMTQAELARRVGVTRQTILALEKNKYAPSLELAFRLAQLFGRKVDEVFAYAPPGEGKDRPQEAPKVGEEPEKRLR